MKLILRLAWQLLLLPALATALCLDDCQEAESSSLQLLYNQTAGYQWTNSNGWAASTDYVPHCSWYGVTCCSGADDTGLADTGHGTLPCDSPGAVTALVRSSGPHLAEAWWAFPGSQVQGWVQLDILTLSNRSCPATTCKASSAEMCLQTCSTFRLLTCQVCSQSAQLPAAFRRVSSQNAACPASLAIE